MKKIIATLTIVLAVSALAPVLADAHMGDGSSDEAITNAEFDEMQDVMLKMMNGEDLSQSEWQEMTEFMTDHHGEGSFPMMMGVGGMMGQDNFEFGRIGTLNGGFAWNQGSSFIQWLFVATALVWLFVGILLSVFLFRKLSK